MAKERKTKRQKKISDRRHSQDLAAPVHAENLYSLNLTDKTTGSKTKSLPKTPTKDYSFLKYDMRKTAIVTSMIVLFELGIYWISVGY